MLDIHSHILPKMDDGSKSVEMSLEMLRLSKAGGVDTMVSTSHFYADREPPERFLERRSEAFEKIRPHLTDAHPNLLFGAEVLYFPGVLSSESITSLAIEGTDLILIEMPFVPWQSRILQELHALRSNFGLSIILAHVERYIPIQKKPMFRELLEQGFYIQCNAEAFVDRKTRRFAMDLLKTGALDFIGTDCHNLDSRRPNMPEAKKIIEKKLGANVWNDFCAHSLAILDDHRVD